MWDKLTVLSSFLANQKVEWQPKGMPKCKNHNTNMTTNSKNWMIRKLKKEILVEKQERERKLTPPHAKAGKNQSFES